MIVKIKLCVCVLFCVYVYEVRYMCYLGRIVEKRVRDRLEVSIMAYA